MAADYARRIGRFCQFEMRELRGEAAFDGGEQVYKIVVDPEGRHLTSADVAGLIAKAQNGAVRKMWFLVGGADGLSPSVRLKADLVLALSRLTLPHELARVVLLEQIYRAFTILRHHPYAR